MVFITAPAKEGDTKKCPECDIDLIGRLTDYKGRYADKLQWQITTERKAHYDKDGNCKSDAPKPETLEQAQETPASKKEITAIYSGKEDNIMEDTLRILSLRKQITDIVKEYEIDPHPGMIWEMTALLFKKHFGVKE